MISKTLDERMDQRMDQHNRSAFPRRSRAVTLTAITLASALAFSGCAPTPDNEDPASPPSATGMVYYPKQGVWINQPGYKGPSYVLADPEKDDKKQDAKNPPASTGMVYYPQHHVWIARPGYFGPSYIAPEPTPRWVMPRVYVESESAHFATPAIRSGVGASHVSAPAPHAAPSYGGFGGIGHGAGE